MCKEVCVYLCVVVNHACYIWILNDTIDSNICFFSVLVVFLFFYCISE